MRKTRLAAVVALTLASACSTRRPGISVEIQPDGMRVATLSGSQLVSDAERILLFHCAESTLEAGGVYFSIRGRSWSSTERDEERGYEFRPAEASVYFRVESGPHEAPGAYDARLVVREAAPELRVQLSPAALRRLEAVERETGRLDGPMP